jgi:RPA family protein
MVIDNNIQPARRVLAEELNEATDRIETEEDRAPNFSLLPTGAKANRVFVVGTLKDVEDTKADQDNEEYLRAKIRGATGTFYAYAGQYQPEATSFLRDAETPMFVAMKAKVSTYTKDDGEVNVTLRPEEVSEVTREDRNRWAIETAQRTLSRIDAFERDDPIDGSVPDIYEYDADLEAYRQLAIEALEEVHDAQLQTDADAEASVEDSDEAEVTA